MNDLFGEIVPPTTVQTRAGRAGTFIDNMNLPVHRWFRYSAGYSAEWVQRVISSRGLGSYDMVLDPFAGSGTTMLACDQAGVPSVGVESHPFVSRIAKAKLMWNTPTCEFYDFAVKVLDKAQRTKAKPNPVAELLDRCYDATSLGQLYALRDAWMKLDNQTPASHLVWFTITAILRSTSQAGTAQWQYVLPNKSKSRVASPFDAFKAHVVMMRKDMAQWQETLGHSKSTLICGDARTCEGVSNDSISLMLTSPPYANNYDYADTTRLEMTFWNEIRSWSDLHESVRKYLIVSSSQHAAKDKLNAAAIIEEPLLACIADEMRPIIAGLAEERVTHCGKKQYHAMVAGYFLDMSRVWQTLRRVCRDGSTAIMVVGDSAPYGVYVPVDRWLGNLAVEHGFKSYSFDKLRDRNTKWKNRKHTVPLHEGILTVEG